MENSERPPGTPDPSNEFDPSNAAEAVVKAVTDKRDKAHQEIQKKTDKMTNQNSGTTRGNG